MTFALFLAARVSFLEFEYFANVKNPAFYQFVNTSFVVQYNQGGYRPSMHIQEIFYDWCFWFLTDPSVGIILLL